VKRHDLNVRMLRERERLIGVEIDPAIDREGLRGVAHDADRAHFEARVTFQMHQDPIAGIEADPAIGARREVMRFPAERFETERAGDLRAADPTGPRIPAPHRGRTGHFPASVVGVVGGALLQARRAFPVAALGPRGLVERGEIIEVAHDQNGISSSKSARVVVVTGSPWPTSSSRTCCVVGLRSPPPRSTIRSARISVVFRFTPSLSVYSLDWSFPST